MMKRIQLPILAAAAFALTTPAAFGQSQHNEELQLPAPPSAGPGEQPGVRPPPDESPQTKAAPPPKAEQSEAKGPPGMMGLPWPKSPDEAEATLKNLFAHLATTNEPFLAGQIALSIEKLWRLPGGDTINLLIDRAGQFSAKNENEKALKLLDAAVELAPDYADAWNRRAYAYYRMDNTAAALGDLRRALALEPNNFRALDAMAKIFDAIGDKKNALKAYDQLLKIYPEIEGAKEQADVLKKAVEGQGI